MPNGHPSVDTYFQSTAADWLAIYSKKDVHSQLYQRRRDEVLSLAADLDLEAGARVLDVGCGPGLIAVTLAERGLHVTAIDMVPEMVEMTRDRAAASNVGERVVCEVCDGMLLPSADEQFDLIVAVGYTEWLESPGPAIREVARVLKRDGHLIVTAINYWSLNFIVDPLKTPLVSPLKKVVRKVWPVLTGRPAAAVSHRRSARKMNSYFRDAGLKLVRFRRFGFGPFTVFGRPVFSNSTGWALHSKLQELADRNWPLLRSMGHVYIAVAKKAHS